ncbi:Uncharacterized membrane protein YfcA [Jiangella alkaliphila]|uniref:Probable membrane transporter protein n=1 Tax=Jiangella alkaliphila TaxID=419479 RepID=A0A1H2L6D8_9ACTN|nr:sulfite exporter TauE/SafE family protein [Jiangella alkaliphila]SDU76543.1 Uncharacterized membrane protein YfcA [Jiangella alkaliphila]
MSCHSEAGAVDPSDAGPALPRPRVRQRPAAAFLAGALVGVLGGLIGLGGAEFRLPILIGMFGFAALAAVILNKGDEPGRRRDHAARTPRRRAAATTAVGVLAGAGIGVVAALMGVAGGELLIPAIVLLYGVNIKVAGSLSLLVSLPTMLVAFARYSRDRSFVVLREQTRFLVTMAAGSVAGTIAGGFLLGIVSDAVLIPVLVAILLLSAIKVWRHR